MAIIAAFCAKLLGGTDRGMEFGIMTFAVTLPMAAAVGWIPMGIAISVGFIAVLGLGWALFLRRAGA